MAGDNPVSGQVEEPQETVSPLEERVERWRQKLSLFLGPLLGLHASGLDPSQRHRLRLGHGAHRQDDPLDTVPDVAMYIKIALEGGRG